LCELHRAGGGTEVIGPSRLSSSDGSVVHTGDSLTGASSWDDERIFVFLDALPSEVERVVLSVVSRNRRAFRDVAGASCHISDYTTEEELVSIRLTSLAATECTVATLHRRIEGWILRCDQALWASSSIVPHRIGVRGARPGCA
jgi:tellurium resistance protein TerZ